MDCTISSILHSGSNLAAISLKEGGTPVRGDQAIFMAQIKDGVQNLTAGTFMTGKYPFMMFGLPAAALAIYHEARPERKKIVGGIDGFCSTYIILDWDY
ncbi:PTS transporter subunit EIIC [Peribacillus frigoritolerans]|nr:PTS transporter subunit EIIC [Peribacillus frigoritolerans]